MKIKNLRVFLASVLTFVTIGGIGACNEYKLKQKDEMANSLKAKLEVDLQDAFIPVDEEIELDLEPEVKRNK